MSRTVEQAQKGMRVLWIVGGAVFVCIGVVGIFVPGLPTTVFLLIASWMFARSSKRLHRMLHEHRQLGPYLEMARRRRMPARARAVSLVLMWSGIAITIFTGFADGWVMRIIMICAGLAGTTAILSMRGSADDLRSV